LREAIDPALVARYGEKLPAGGMGVGYAIYPWREGKLPKALARELGTDYLVFDLEETGGGFRASNQQTGLSVQVDSLDALPDAVRDEIAARWPSLVPEIPGMLNWQRTLTESGFVPHRR
jgi:hypothetical protein